MNRQDNTITGRTPPEDGPHARLTQTWQWLDTQRHRAPEGADVWDIRWQVRQTGPAYLTNLLQTLLAGRYRLSPLQLHGEGRDRKAVWGAQDALVLKWVALALQHQLPLHPSCEHVRGHGGGRQSIDTVHRLLTQPDSAAGPLGQKKTAYRWICRTDIRDYYRHINRDVLYAQVKQHVSDPVMLDLVHQYLHYTVENAGPFHTPEKGICRACPLSPLMGALHLNDMDAHFSAQKDIHYARFMDDVIILAGSRHTKRLEQEFSEYGFEAHPDKTFIGKTQKGFDWMGAWLTDEGVADIAPRAKANHREKVRRLYEQLARIPNWLRKRRQQQVHARVSTYRKRWNIWAGGTLLIIAAGTTGPAHADRIIIVLASNMPSGITTLPGGDFSSSSRVGATPSTAATYTGTDSLVAVRSTGGISVGQQCGDSAGGLTYCQQLPDGRYGIRVDALNVYLVPVGGYLSAGLGPIGGTVPVSSSVRTMLDCSKIVMTPGHSQLPSCSATSAFYLKATSPYPPVGAIYEASTDISFSPVCNNCIPGSTKISAFNLVNRPINRSTPLPKPTDVVVSGLTCNLAPVPTQTISSAGKTSTSGALVGTSDFNMTITCAGSNTSGITVPISVEFQPTGGNYTEQNKIKNTAQPSFYSTLAEGSPDCTGTGLNQMQIGDGKSNLWHSYAVKESGTSTTKALVWALCSSGDMTQVPGKYDVTLTASVVSF